MEIIISQILKDICPEVVLGCISCQVMPEKFNGQLWEEIDELNRNLSIKFNVDSIKEVFEIKKTRETYKKLGNDPNRYRVSSESLLRRILQGKKLYQINNIVDINNFISLKYCFSVGTYDLNKIEFPITFRVGKEGEVYKGIGKEDIKIENLPVLVDSVGCFGSPTSDSIRTMINLETTNVLMVIYSFSGDGNINNALSDAKELLSKYALATNLENMILK